MNGAGESLSLVSMKVLCVLLERPGEVVSRSTFFDQVWGRQVVSDDALTRAVSDLRTLFAQYSSDKLIETLPKRGYRWLPEVTTELPVPESAAVAGDGAAGTSAVQPAGLVTAGMMRQGLLVLLLVLVASFAIRYAMIDQTPPWIQLALMPVEASEGESMELALILEERLRDRLLQTDVLRFLSAASLREYTDKPYTLLVAEQDTLWVVEGSIRQQEGNARITLSLVDARTSLVTYQARATMDSGNSGLDAFVTGFVSATRDLLSPRASP